MFPFFSNSDLWRSSPRASPPSLCLDMIAEHDNDDGNTTTNVRQTSVFAQQYHPISTSLPENTPQISVTDDSGTTFIHRRAPPPAVCDPLMGFQMFTNDLLSMPSSSFDTAYYYSFQPVNSSTTETLAYATTIPTPTVNPNGDAILSSRTMPDVCAQLEYVLNSMTDVICRNVDDLGCATKNVANSAANASALCNNQQLQQSSCPPSTMVPSRRVSFQSNDGTRVEIGVSPVDYQSDNLCCVEFRCIDGDRNRYQALCTQVLAGLNL